MVGSVLFFASRIRRPSFVRRPPSVLACPSPVLTAEGFTAGGLYTPAVFTAGGLATAGCEYASPPLPRGRGPPSGTAGAGGDTAGGDEANAGGGPCRSGVALAELVAEGLWTDGM